MKNDYTTPKVEIIYFEQPDVIKSSEINRISNMPTAKFKNPKLSVNTKKQSRNEVEFSGFAFLFSLCSV